MSQLRKPSVLRAIGFGTIAVLAAGVTIANFNLDRSPKLEVERTINGGAPRHEQLAGKTWLETGPQEQALVRLPIGIGSFALGPNAKFRWSLSQPTEQRFRLDRGAMEVKLNAPPNIVVIDTPNGAMVDRGATFSVDAQPALTRLKVHSGEVSLEADGPPSRVPRQMYAMSSKGRGPSAPLSESASAQWAEAVTAYEQRADPTKLSEALSEARVADAPTIWHLAQRAAAGPLRMQLEGRLLELVPGLATADAGAALEGWWPSVNNAAGLSPAAGRLPAVAE